MNTLQNTLLQLDYGLVREVKWLHPNNRDTASFFCQKATNPLARLPMASENYQRASKDQYYLPMWASDIVHILKEHCTQKKKMNSLNVEYFLAMNIQNFDKNG